MSVALRLPVAVCAHTRFAIYKHVGGALDDHDTTYGHCGDCDAWLVLTTYASGRIDDRPMTASELERIAQRETQCERDEWLVDYMENA